MRKGTIAQALLTWLSNEERASAFVGDLLEQRVSGWRFWLATFRLALALSWRCSLAVVLAAVSFFLIELPYSLIVQPRQTVLQSHAWMTWAMYLFAAAACLGTTAAIATALYGLRDRVTHVSVAIWLLVTACALLAWLPYGPGIIGGLLIVAFSAMLAGPRTRLPLAGVLASAATYGATFMYFGRALQWLETQVLVYGMRWSGDPCCNAIHTMTGQNAVRVALELGFAMIAWLISVLLAALVLTRMRSSMTSSRASHELAA